jgi:hypothetical protein
MLSPTEVSIPRAAALAVLGALLISGAGGADEPKSPPGFKPIRAAVSQHFAQIPLQQMEDVISRGQVQPLLSELARLGLEVPDAKAFLERCPADDSFLVVQLRTRHGREFMRHLAGSPGAYEKLERVAAMKRGRRTVAEMIRRGEKGAEVFIYLAEEPDGRKAGRLMARRGQSPDFNQPTRKIYTVAQLLAELQKLYRQAHHPAAQSPRPQAPVSERR